ncbi:hypothetical protein PRK78_001823 [Emydomyces testavorans]|uniref:Myb-like DNA-binding domain-containing protein n=1 Tax=Emydomyces testavorans TaxID=2070801 RepID=A0AAF0IFW2_9EURO|nr:hypothetical protein PRK78_001823 [Emydomyces testavorans]
MADINSNQAENASTRISDEVFMMECFKHLQSPAVVDVAGVARGLGYSNPASVANRLGRLKKKFNVSIATVIKPNNDGGEDAAIGAGSVPTTPATPRKRAKATKAGTPNNEAKGDTPGKTPTKSGGRKRKAPATEASKAVASAAGEGSPEKKTKATEAKADGGFEAKEELFVKEEVKEADA